jgi:glycosyltransferase involved in cell wall biosynthesis
MIIEPIAYGSSKAASTTKKQRLILNVGRFSNLGHGKNQHLVAKAFIEAVARKSNSDWRLVFAGTLDHSSSPDVAYFQELTTMCRDHPVSLIEGAPRAEVDTLFAAALVYIHATGLGINASINPELTEHFGMTVAEAINAGCLVIVHDSGNPPSLVRRHGSGTTYATYAELVECLSKAMSDFDSGRSVAPADPGRGFTHEIFNRQLSLALTTIGFYQ